MTYDKLWKLAKPYYMRGRPNDVAHVEWMLAAGIEVCKHEKIDDTLFLPLIILHDIGYAEVGKGNSFALDRRKEHMKIGANIAKELLEKLSYPSAKVEKIAYYVGVHDNWALDEYSVYKDSLLAAFTDLDFLWMATPKGFEVVRKELRYTRERMITFLAKDKKHIKAPFATETTKNMYHDLMNSLRTQTD